MLQPQRQPWPRRFTVYEQRILQEIIMDASGTQKKITGMANGGAGSQDASTVKQMEDHVLAAIGDNVAKMPVHAGTTAALPANTRTAEVLKADAVGAFPTIDGVPPVINQKYLVKNEGGGASHINNGIYELTVIGDGGTEWELTRRHDMEGGESASGAMVPISDGTVNGDTTFKCINNIGSDTINTDALEFWFWGQTTDHGNLKNVTANQHHTPPTNLSDLTDDLFVFVEDDIPMVYRFFVVEEIRNDPPGLPADMEAYLIGTAGTGDWSGNDNQIAIWSAAQTAWIYVQEGQLGLIFDKNTMKYYRWDNTNSAIVEVPIQRADVTLAGVAPVDGDVSTWDDGDRGLGIGTGARQFVMVKRGTAAKYVEMAGHDRLHVGEHTYSQPDALDPANIGQYGVAELDAGGQVGSNPKDHATRHQNAGADEINVGGLSGELADDQPPKSHALGGSAHSSDTKANLITKLSDVTEIITNNSGEINGFATLTDPDDADEFLVEDAGASNAKKKMTIANLMSWFEPNSYVSEGQSSTTSGTFQDKIDQTPTLPAGDYIVEWYAEIWTSTSGSSQRRMECAVDIAGSEAGRRYAEGYVYGEESSAQIYQHFSGHKRITHAGGTINLKLKYRRISVGGTAYVQRGRIAIRRVS